ncbi:hypothetical protein Tco_0901144 [Tanacetum coccineum]
MLLGINLILLVKVNDARHNLLLLVKDNAARHNLLLLVKVNAARHKLTTAGDVIVNGYADGVDCLPNATIFEQLALMGYEQMRLSYKELDDSLVRAATTTSSLEAEQYTVLTSLRTRSTGKTPNEAVHQGTSYRSDKKLKKKDKSNIIKLKDFIKLVEVLASEEVFVAEQSGNVVEEVVVVIDAANTIPVSTAIITDVEVTLAQALAELKSAKPKADKAKVKADYQLAQRLQAQEQEELTDEEKARLFVQFLEQRRKHFAAKRVEEKRNKPPTQAQQRKIMCTYLKNMEGKKPKDLKNKSFDSIQKMFDRAFKRMVKNFNKEDLEVLWSIVKARFMKTEPVNYMDNFLLLNLKTMFEHHVEDNVWKNQHGLVKELNWKLYDSCGVHCVKWHLSFLDWSRNSLRKDMYLNEVFGSILLVIDEALDET